MKFVVGRRAVLLATIAWEIGQFVVIRRVADLTVLVEIGAMDRNRVAITYQYHAGPAWSCWASH